MSMNTYRDVKSLEKNIENIQKELANMQIRLREVLNKLAMEANPKEV